MSSIPRRRSSARSPSYPAWLLSALALALLTPAATAATVGERAKATVERIAAFGPRPAGSAAERRVVALLESRLAVLGYETTVQPFPLPRGGSSSNVVARSGGAVRVLVVAHLDGVSAGPAANDNASGVAVLLELGRALRNEEGVILAALGAEERVETGSGLHLGSQHLLSTLSRSERAGLRLAVSLDMVGFGPTLNVRGLEPSPNASARLVLRHGGTYRQDTGQSDHAELTRAGVPATWIQWRWDPCWHEACDTAARVKSWKLGAACRLALAAIREALGTASKA